MVRFEGEAHEDSDIDVLVICDDDLDIARVRDSIYRGLKKPLTIIPVDFIFVTKRDFDKKKLVGGVCMVAHDNGMLVYKDGKPI